MKDRGVRIEDRERRIKVSRIKDQKIDLFHFSLIYDIDAKIKKRKTKQVTTASIFRSNVI